MKIQLGRAYSSEEKRRKLHNLCTQTRITPKETIVNMAYQRKLEQRNVRKIKPFDIRFMGLPYVAEISFNTKTGKGVYEIVDGQTRIHCFTEMYGDDTEFDVQVFENTTLQERAEYYSILNENRTGVNPVDKFKARLTAEDPETATIYELVKDSGAKIGGLDSVKVTTDYPVTNSIGKLIDIYRHGSLSKVLKVIFGAYAQTSSDYSNKAFSHKMLASVDMVVTAFADKYDEDRLIEIISKEASFVWNNSGIGAVLSAEKKKVFAAESIVTAYNKSLPKSKRLDSSKIFDHFEKNFKTKDRG